MTKKKVDKRLKEPADVLRTKIIDAISSNPGVTVSGVCGIVGRTKSSPAVYHIMMKLAKMGIIEHYTYGPKTCYRLSVASMSIRERVIA